MPTRALTHTRFKCPRQIIAIGVRYVQVSLPIYPGTPISRLAFFVLATLFCGQDFEAVAKLNPKQDNTIHSSAAQRPGTCEDVVTGVAVGKANAHEEHWAGVRDGSRDPGRIGTEANGAESEAPAASGVTRHSMRSGDGSDAPGKSRPFVTGLYGLDVGTKSFRRNAYKKTGRGWRLSLAIESHLAPVKACPDSAAALHGFSSGTVSHKVQSPHHGLEVQAG